MTPVPESRPQFSHTTVFLRNRPQLEELAGVLLPRVWPGGGALDALVCGGSIGCEAFSLLVALREFAPAGIEARVLSVDISPAVTDQARAACFAPETFEPLFGMEGGMPAEMRERWFEAVEGGGWRPAAALRAAVTFETINLQATEPGGPFGLVVCQNVLTHYEPAAAMLLLDRLLGLAAPKAVFVCSGVDLALKSRITGAGFEPWLGRIDEIHEAFVSHRMHYRQHPGEHYFELEDIDRSRPDWRTRYATLFHRG